MSYLPSLPQGSLIDIFQQYPDFVDGIHETGEAVMRGPSPFSAGQRELMAAYVSALNDCTFCRRAHMEAARHFGIDPKLLDAVLANPEAPELEPALRPVFRYLDRVTRDPGRVAQGDVDAVLSAGWNEAAVVHTNLVAGMFGLMNRIVDGLGLEGDDRVVQMAGRQLYEQGYHGVRAFIRAASKGG